MLTDMGVDGMLVAPGYHYESVDREIFLTREEIQQKFRRMLEISRHYRLTSTPMFLEFAAGLRDYPCSPWSTVTFTPRGLEGPLLPDRQGVHAVVGRVLERDRLGLLGVAPGRPVPELRHALGVRGLRGARAAEAPDRHAAHGRVEPARLSRARRAPSTGGSDASMDLVTGGTGFIGAHVVRALAARGEAPRCLVRPGSDRRSLDGVGVELVEGDLLDPPTLARAVAGVRTVYHCAADYRLYARDPRQHLRHQRAGHREPAARRRRRRGRAASSTPARWARSGAPAATAPPTRRRRSPRPRWSATTSGASSARSGSPSAGPRAGCRW